MIKFEDEFNNLLVETFHLILKNELKMIKSINNCELSMREIHLIEIIGKNNGKVTVSDVGQVFQITLASVTTMVNKLSTLGYIRKEKNNSDARSVLLSLTDKGKEIDNHHYEFHKKMVNYISSSLNNEEQEVCAKIVSKINDLFTKELE